MAHSDFVTRYRQGVTRLLQASDELQALDREYVALDLGNSLMDGDFDGANVGITKAQLVAAVGSVEAIDALLATGHATNLYRVKA